MGGITYVFNDYFWDNSVAQNLIFSVMCYWVFGIWVIMLMVLFSTLFSSNIGVLAGTGGVVLLFTLLNIIPKIKEYFEHSAQEAQNTKQKLITFLD